ncbi:GDSL-type esterase/lipase family protein [Granulicella aggregans]|nr:GDSL-type esterase/lipase family protein [Granulicella aggregans]
MWARRLQKSGCALNLAVIFVTATLLPMRMIASGPAPLNQAGNPAMVPADRLSEDWWKQRHEAVLHDVAEHPDTQLLLIGDSITNNYDKSTLPDENFQPTWKTFYEPRKALNLGFSGDTTANVLWRLDHGEVAGLHPTVALILIGTNNTGFKSESAEQTEVGIDAVIANLEQRLPETKILLLGILPSDISDSKTETDLAVNAYLANGYSENPRVTYLEVGSIFYKNNKLDASIFYDPRLPQHGKPLHPDTNGQRMMAEAIEPTLAKLMGDSPRMPLDAMTEINTALIPVPKLEQDSYDWYARHHAELNTKLRINPRVVMIGDSITHFWGGLPNANHVNGPTAWQHLFRDDAGAVLNLGFGWDRTQNVLWRLRQGEFDGLTPRAIVLMIGTNNLSGSSNARASTPQEIVAGIEAIREELHRRSPSSRLIVMAILPRGRSAADPFRVSIIATNKLLSARFGNDASVTYLDIGAKFLDADGTLPVSMMSDGVHPTDAGYEIWADALADTFRKLNTTP